MRQLRDIDKVMLGTLIRLCHEVLSHDRALIRKLHTLLTEQPEPEQQTEEQIDLLALLDQGYETGLNSDIDSEEPFAIFQINIGRNGCESHIVSTGRTTREALEKLAKQLVPEPDAPQEGEQDEADRNIATTIKTLMRERDQYKEQRDTFVRLARELENSADSIVIAGSEKTGVGRRELGRLNAYAEEVGGES